MGTRSLTCIYMNGEYKLAQYNQWDGYPEGLGLELLKKLHQMYNTGKYKSFKNKVSDLLFVDDNDDLYMKNRPWTSRDTGSDIIDWINRGIDRTRNNLDFAADSLFCEWCYVIDFDKNTFEIYKGFNKTPLNKNDRFYFLMDESNKLRDNMVNKDYYPVKLFATFDLYDLPDKSIFLSETIENEEE